MASKRFWAFAVTSVLCLAAGHGVRWFDSYGKSSVMIGRTIAVTWGDGTQGCAFKAKYGAHVFLVPNSQGYAVRARIYIDRPDYLTAYFHDCGTLGHVQTPAQAVEKWGDITWTDDAVYMGDPNRGGHKVPRKVFQRHR